MKPNSGFGAPFPYPCIPQLPYAGCSIGSDVTISSSKTRIGIQQNNPTIPQMCYPIPSSSQMDHSYCYSCIPVYPIYSPSSIIPSSSVQPQFHRDSKKRQKLDQNNDQNNGSSQEEYSLKVFMSYLRQQYAYYPRWWYYLRIVVKCVQSYSKEKREKYIFLLQLLLSGKKKERKLLLSYLGISKNLPNDTSIDHCFHPSQLHFSLVYLLNVCEEIYYGQIPQPISDKDEHEECTELSKKYSSEMNLFEDFLKCFDSFPKQKEKLLSVLQEALNQYSQFGYTSYGVLYESIYSSIYTVPNAIQHFSLLMDV